MVNQLHPWQFLRKKIVTSCLMVATATVGMVALPVLVPLPVYGAGPPENLAAAPASINGPLTLRASLQIPETWDASGAGIEQLWLVGLATNPTGEQTLALTWTVDQSAWFPQWKLQLHNSTEEPLSVETSSGQLSQVRNGAIDLLNVTPLRGHTYEIALSFHPITGAGNLALVDSGSGQLLYGGSFTLQGVNSPLSPVSNAPLENANQATDTISHLVSVTPGLAPVGTKWAIGCADGGGFVATTLFQTTEQPYLELMAPIGTAEGHYEVWLEQQNKEQQWAIIMPQPGTNQKTALPRLPAGKSAISLRYTENGQTLWSETRSIAVGTATVAFTKVDVDRQEGLLRGSFQIMGEQLPEMNLLVQATLNRLVWDAANRTYSTEPAQVVPVFTGKVTPSTAGQDQPVEFAYPLPAENGLYKVTLAATTPDGITLQVEGAESLIAQYPVAVPLPDEPYTVVVLPDSQYYLRSYPTVWLRQMEWIAEHAANRNIGLVLHMGDLTDANSPSEWRGAYTYMSLLNNLVPYVLAAGNHDYSAKENDVGDRNRLLLNNYFHAADFPLLGGTFTPDRLENSYHEINLGGTDYLVIALEYAPRNEVLEWANQVVKEHPNQKIIMITHSYVAINGKHTSTAFTAEPGAMNNGQSIWQDFVQHHPNFFMALSGHIPVTTIPRNVSRGAAGNPVYEMLTDYQMEPNGGNGWLLLMEFRPDQTVHVQAYSPYLNDYRANTDRYGFGNAFSIDLAGERFVTP